MDLNLLFKLTKVSVSKYVAWWGWFFWELFDNSFLIRQRSPSWQTSDWQSWPPRIIRCDSGGDNQLEGGNIIKWYWGGGPPSSTVLLVRGRFHLSLCAKLHSKNHLFEDLQNPFRNSIYNLNFSAVPVCAVFYVPI